MSYELVITEKPAASQKIADALADGKAIKENINAVPIYRLTHGSQDIVVACAVGHLFGLGQIKKGFEYPVFDVEWKPAAELNKGSAFTRKYLNALKKLSKEATSFTVATDYDVEGEVIGVNALRYACKQKDGARMKFSTLTKPDLVKAYEEKNKHLDWGQANAGLTRHELDWYWGINLSRALTTAIKTTGGFKVMSSGRVQGPSLKIVVEKEKEIKAFKAVPFWMIELNGNVTDGKLTAWHETDKFWKKDEADKVLNTVKEIKKGKINEVKKTSFQQPAPPPFDLTSLQTEAYRVFKIHPKESLSIAQKLYTAGWISYPRTSSNQIPPAIGYEKIMQALSKQSEYTDKCKELMKKTLKPNNGKKSDPAHPAIYPTGIIPRTEDRQKKIYDLIVKRFLATFSDPATRETMTVKIDVNKEIFVAKGTRTAIKVWHDFYEPYVKLKEEELPKVEQDEIVKIKKIQMHEKETQPPRRYTPASIIKELEKKGLGTKATRAQIIDTLFQRGYVDGRSSIEATVLGINTIDTLEKYCPRILDEELTRHFEMEMQNIREGKRKPDAVLTDAKDKLIVILKKFKEKEKQIGKELASANLESRKQASHIGKCPTCAEGSLSLRKGKFGMFIACDKYPDCKTTFSMPAGALIKSAKKICEDCTMPMITVIRKAKKPQEICINKECPSKKLSKEEEKKVEEKPCPKCDGKLILRKSVYGSFLGCSKYPKCRTTEKIKD